jgi:hypothetical protein
MRKAIDRSFSTRLLRTTALSLALITASAAGVHAETVTVQGANGVDGASGVDGGLWDLPGGNGTSGGDASATANSKSDSSNTAYASGGNGGNGGEGEFGGTAGNGGNGTAIAVTMHAGDASATATGGNGGNGGDAAYWAGANGGNGGDANAKSIATGAGSASVTSSASATGGNGGGGGFFLGGATSQNGVDGNGGSATAFASAKSESGSATATATATGGAVYGGPYQPPYPGSATATSTATTNRGGVSVQSTAAADSGEGSITTLAVAQGGSDQAVVNPSQTLLTAWAFSTALPDKAYAASVVDGASNVADALLGPRDTVLGIAILGEQGYGDSASATFDFRFRGDLLLGLIDGSGEFSISANGVEILSESFVDDDSVINLGSNFGPNIDLTFSGSGVFAVGSAFPGSAVPEPSTWAMMLLGFAGLGFAGYRASRRTEAAREISP